MNWQSFQTHNEAPTHAFEVMCNQLFELWGRRTYGSKIDKVSFVNGAGGDGGVEAYIKLKNGDIIVVQSKWFPDTLTASKITQVKNSIKTAMSVRPQIIRYIVCIPRDLASSKKGKNEKIILDSEEQRWNTLRDNIINSFPKLELELWDESRILVELQQPEAAGVQRYWFEKSELNPDTIRNSFERQQKGWLALKYIPTLHCKGKIQDKVNRFLGSIDICQKELNQLDKLIDANKRLADSINQLIELENSTKDFHIDLQVLEKNRGKAQYNYKALSHIRETYISEQVIILDSVRECINYSFSSLKSLLKEYQFGYDKYYGHINDIHRMIKKIADISDKFSLGSLIERTNYNKVIVVGEPGTGKTHGVANAVETLIETEHISVLVQAKSISSKSGWEKIICDTLKLSSSWDEDSLWTALEAMSYRRQHEYILKNPEQEITIIPKVIIFVDGIDECRPYDNWIVKMREVDAICQRHPRIKFCFSCRPYVFNNLSSRDPLLHNKLELPSDGDCSVEKLFDKYMLEYGIDISKVKWIKWVIRTPFALRLFCELYRDKPIYNINRTCITITSLIKAKIDSLDTEYRMTYHSTLGKNDFIMRRCLNLIEETLSEKNKCLREDLIDKMNSEVVLTKISNKDDLLCFLENTGLLQSYTVDIEGAIQIPQTYYSLGMQPIFDYLAAIKVVNSGESVKDYNWSNLALNIGAMQMLSVILLEDQDVLIYKYRDVINKINDEELFDLTCFALVNASAEKSNHYVDVVQATMRKNATCLKAVINRILIYTSRESNNRLNATLLHDYMMSFEKPAQRDLVWSLPPQLNKPWNCYEQLNLENESFQLNNDDIYTGIPIIYAWGLTTTVNSQRVFYRKNLANWAKNNPMEFYKLFCITIKTNDPQMQGDLCSIAMSTCYVGKDNYEYTKSISEWVQCNVFSDKKIQYIRNACIRYYCRAIAECAYSYGIIGDDEIQRCRPPYKHDNMLLELNIPAMKGTRMGGYGPIDYDLSRYVLCDPITHQFFSTYGNKNDYNIKHLLKLHAEKYEVSSLNEDQLIISAAYNYLCSMGWNKRDFYGSPNGGKINENLGLDIAIQRRYRPADHGSMSEVMTVTEKYVWCAKNEILGYLADRLKYDNYEHGRYLIDDYGLLENYPNPILEFYQDNPEELRQKSEWFIPESLLETKNFNINTWDDVEQLIKAAPTPTFSKWLDIEGGKGLVLYSCSFINNPIYDVESLMWISSGVIGEEDLQLFIKDIKYGNKSLWEMLNNPAEFHTYPEAECYISPMEVCWLEYKKEHGGTELFQSVDGKEYIIKRAVAECTTNLLEYGDISYKLPSKYIRTMLKIEDGNGYLYYDKQKQVAAQYSMVGEKWHDEQYILKVGKDTLYKELAQRREQLFWIIRLKRESSAKLREKFDNKYVENDRVWIVFYINNMWEVYEYTYNPREDKDNEIVYISMNGSGKKYHKHGCRYIKSVEVGVNKSYVEKEGYTPCKICFENE